MGKVGVSQGLVKRTHRPLKQSLAVVFFIGFSFCGKEQNGMRLTKFGTIDNQQI